MTHPQHVGRRLAQLGALILILGLTAPAGISGKGAGQSLDSTDRAHAKQMLEQISRAIQSEYYDQAFHGIDVKAHFKAASGKLDSATSMNHAYAIIAQALLDFGDSHLYFVPPLRSAKYEYGWQMKAIGDDCYVVAVNPKSDAGQKGLKPGDLVLRVEPFPGVRSEVWKLQYYYRTLSPRTSLRVMVQSPGGQPRQLELAAAVKPGPPIVDVSVDDVETRLLEEAHEARVEHNRAAHIGDVAIWKLDGFSFPPTEVDRVMDDTLKGANSLVLDMRGNGGGYVRTLEQIAGRLFDHDVKIADAKGRRSLDGIAAKKRKTPFTGKIVAIVDSESASAAELLARTIQLEERGIVIGDRSSGAVMQALFMSGAVAMADTVIPFYASITNADLIMKDGKSLEHIGIAPDQVVLPSATDLAAGRDPVLARAVTLVGGSIDPDAAGALFPVRWK